MFGKILLVFTAVVSVLLAGVSMVAYFAVPGMTQAMAELPDYSFERQYGETVRWSVSRRLGDRKSVASNQTVFEAVIAATNDAQGQLQAESGEAATQLQSVNAQLEQHKAEQAQDAEAMKQRGEQLQLVAVDYEKQVTDISGEFQRLSVDARIVRDETNSRRQDVARLDEELEELRTHKFELRELERTLTDQLLRLRLDIQNLQLRADQVRQQLDR
ncbi:MAG: hypothetical protein MK110_12270 [Fuerstiella sp.]|nr:hypothetical protein [Fuerstiella sp.]